MKLTLPQQAKIVELLPPAADAAGRTSAIAVSLKNSGRVTIIAHITQGNAATVALTVQQASAVAKTGAKALTNPAKIWANLDTAATDTLVAQTDANSYTTDAAVKNKIVVIEVDADCLDVNNGFDCVLISTGASNAANITQAMAILHDQRFQSATPGSAILD